MCMKLRDAQYGYEVVDQLFREQSVFAFNLLFDTYRFLFGRGILFGMSSFYVFLLMASKDVAYELYHFCVCYTEVVTVFKIKLAYPSASRTRIHVIVVELLNRYQAVLSRLGIPPPFGI